MSYNPKYATEADVERILQFDITYDTRPSSVQVLDILELIEKEVDSRWLGWPTGSSYGTGYTMTDLYIDVLPPWTDKEPTVLGEEVERVLIEYPIVSMTSLARRTSSIQDEPVWETLTQGYYSGWTEGDSDYSVIWTTGPDGQRYGIGWHFYSSKKPKAGRARLKASFTYSYLVPAHILRRYVSLRAAIEVLRESVIGGEPTRLSVYAGGDFQEFVPRQLRDEVRSLQEEVRQIEQLHFPKIRGVVSF